MQDDDPSAPDNVASSFALPTSSTGGHGDSIAVESGALVWNVGALVRRRTFDDIAAIELELERSAEDPFVKCDILFADGERLGMLIQLDRAKDIEIYRAFVTELFERLGLAQRQRIVFRKGAGPASRTLSIVICIVLLALLLGVLLFGVVSGAFFREESAWLAIPLILLFVVVLSGILRRTFKSEQKTCDPETLLRRCLP
jgi:hypothetical protein